jgi:hypothetical protein
MFAEELQTKLLDTVDALAEALNAHFNAAREHAQAEHGYRLSRAKAFTVFATDGTKRTVDHLNSMVDLQCDKEMLRVRLAEAEREALLERVRSLRTEVSAMQSILNAHREEAAAVRYGQSERM